jgi:predicted RNA-binding protein YlqC (UPF0109 family)
MDSSSSSMVSRNVTVSIPQSQIGLFTGENDISLNKYIIEKSQNAYSRSHGGELSIVNVSVVIDGDFGETVVVAKCTADNDLLLNIVESNIHFHTKNFNRTKKTSKPFKSNFARLVFKTYIPEQMIGKFIGSSGKNIKALSSLLEQDASDDGIDATSFRVNITEEDANRSSPKRYFEIRNTSGSSNPVFIFVSATYDGDLRKLFLCIKPRMISSVNECVEPSKPRQEENDYEDIYAPEPNGEDTYA